MQKVLLLEFVQGQIVFTPTKVYYIDHYLWSLCLPLLLFWTPSIVSVVFFKKCKTECYVSNSSNFYGSFEGPFEMPTFWVPAPQFLDIFVILICVISHTHYVLVCHIVINWVNKWQHRSSGLYYHLGLIYIQSTMPLRNAIIIYYMALKLPITGHLQTNYTIVTVCWP